MRRYLQGTLDYACGIYAVINALSCTHGLDLTSARTLFQEAQLSFSAERSLWASFVSNDTDHYWVVKYMISRWCLKAPYELYQEQPFSSSLLGGGDGTDLTRVRMFLPETEDPSGPLEEPAARQEAEQVWQALCTWFAPGVRSKRVALLRFHRFVPGYAYPVVSHWTTANSLSSGLLHLHDASAERNALFTLEEQALMPQHQDRALLRIVPESLLFLER